MGRKKKEEVQKQEPQTAAPQQQDATTKPAVESQAQKPDEAKPQQGAKPAVEEPKKDAAPARPMVNKQRRTLPCRLTMIELEGQSKNLCKLIAERDDAEESKKAANASWGDRIKGLDSQISEAAKLLDSGTIDKEVECEWRFGDPTPGKKTLYRLDTNAIIEGPVEIKNKDLEQPLPLDGGKKAEGAKPAEPKKEGVQATKKPGDNGKVFVFADAFELEIVDYEDAKNDLKPEDFVKTQGVVAKLDEKKILENVSLPFRAGVRSLVRCKESNGVVYAMWQHHDAKERVSKAKAALDALAAAKIDVKPEGKPQEPAKNEGSSAPVSEPSGMELCGEKHADGKRACKKTKGHDGAHFYGAAENASVEGAKQDPAEPKTKEASPASCLTDEDKGKGVAWCLTKYGISMAEAEGALKRNGKLPLTQDLTANAKAQAYVIDSIDQVEKWVLEMRKDEKAKKTAAA